MPKFVHICQDEKFINSGYNQFEELYPEENLLYVYHCPDRILKHIKVPSSKVNFIDINESFFVSLDTDSIIIFHSLPSQLVPYLKYIDSKIPVIWFLFGFETYSDGNIYNKLIEYDHLTFNLIYPTYDKKKYKEMIKNLLFPIIRLVKKDWRLSEKEVRKKNKDFKINQLQRIDFLGCSFKEEYQFQKQLLKLDSPSFNFWYYPLEKIVNIETPISEDKHRIMIGHSGFPNGNHLDIIDKIKKYQLPNVEITIPFSYGDSNYIELVKPLLFSLRSDVRYMEEFLKLEEYNEILKKVKIAIFNNRRQQALGNIVALLYMGAKVFLSNKNTFYHYLISNNIKIFCYETELDQKSISKGLTKEEIFHNRKILFSLLNSKKLKEELQLSINKVLQK